MKKVTTILTILALISTGIFAIWSDTLAQNNCEERTFTTTAYYSPLPNQAFYIKGDVEADKYLNGQGTHGASGQWVEPGMLAAPGNYAFGETVTIPWLGKWVIRDRGWAIVNAWERGNVHDRIDIWMWHGEEWLIRALIRGKQDITTTYCQGNQYESPSFSWDDMTIYKNFFDMAIIKFNLEQGRKDIFVRTLQEYLIKLGYLKRSVPTGYFWNESVQAICNFQVDYWVVDSHDSEWCGVYGPLTRSTLNSVLKKKWLYPANFWQTSSIDTIIQQAHNANKAMFGTTTQAVMPVYKEAKVAQPTHTAPVVIEKPQEESFELFGKYFKLNDSGYEIIYIQELLTDQWLYKSDITGHFDKETIEAYKKLQEIYNNEPLNFIVANLWQQFLASK